MNHLAYMDEVDGDDEGLRRVLGGGVFAAIADTDAARVYGIGGGVVAVNDSPGAARGFLGQ